MPHRAVHLSDAGRGRRFVVELREPFAPVPSEFLGEHSLHQRGGHRRCGSLQAGQCLSVKAGELLGQRGLHGRHPLCGLHRAALELTEGREQLLCGPRLHLGCYQLRRPAAQPTAQAQGPAAHERRGDRCESGSADQAAGRQIRHDCILAAHLPNIEASVDEMDPSPVDVFVILVDP